MGRRAGNAATGYALHVIPRATSIYPGDQQNPHKTTQRFKLIHSRPSRIRPIPLAQYSVGAVAQYSIGADTYGVLAPYHLGHDY